MSSKIESIKRIARGTLGVSIYTGFYQLMLLLVSIISARLLNVNDFGVVSILQSTVSLFILFATLGLGSVAVKLIAEKNRKYLSSIIWVNLVLCFCSAITIYLFAESIGTLIYQDEKLSPLLSRLAIFVFLCGVTQIQSSILAGKEQYRFLAKVNFFAGLLSIVVLYFMISHLGVNGWLYGVITLEVIKTFALQFIIINCFKPFSLKCSSLELIHVIKLALPIALSGFLVLPVNWFLTRELLLEGGYSDVALLNISNQWIAALTFLPIAIGNAMLPIMSKMNSNSDRKNVSHLALKMNFIVSLALSLIALLFAEYILGFYGHNYTNSVDVFYYILLLAVVLSMTNQLNNRVIADGKPLLMVWSNFIWLIVSLPLGFYLIVTGLGVNGLLIGRFSGYVAKLTYLYFKTNKEVVE